MKKEPEVNIEYATGVMHGIAATVLIYFILNYLFGG